MNAQTNLPAERREPSALEVIKSSISRRADEFKAVLPSHITIEKFQRTVATAVLANPKLLECDRQSFMLACLKLAQDGLLPDGREAALVPFQTSIREGNNWVKKWLVQPMPMAYGLRKKILQSGEVVSLQVGVAYRAELERGNFVYEIGIDPPVRHRPDLFLTDEEAADSQMIAAYSIARIKNDSGGEPYWSVEVMSRREVYKVRQMSQTGALNQVQKWGNDKGKPKQPSGSWVDWESEMWKKTVLRRHSKVLPMSGDILNSILREDEEIVAQGAARMLEVEPNARMILPTADDLAEHARDEGADEETGELPTDARGFTEVDEETARALDAGNDGTLSADNPTAHEGRDDAQRGDQHAEEPEAWRGPVANVEKLIGAAKDRKALDAADAAFQRIAAGLPEEVANMLDNALAAKRKTLAAAA